MKTGKKIAVGLAALTVAIIAAGAVSIVGAQFSVTFTADIKGFDVSIVEGQTDFGDVRPGGEPTLIQSSFTLTNAGDLPAEVYASSTGLSVGEKKITPDCLSIKGVQLSESDTKIATVAAVSNVDFDAALSVPGDQEPGDYSGTVELTFSLT